MHSHDRTLLAKLGFNDADRREPDHDMACKFLAYGVPGKVWARLFPVEHPELVSDVPEWADKIFGRTEVMLMKGSGQYVATIGFADVYIEGYKANWHDKGQRHLWGLHGLIIEVKVDPEPISDTVRQLALYRRFPPREGNTSVALATIATISPRDLQQLASEHIKHIQLGKAFREWCKSAPEVSDVPVSLQL